MNAYIGKSFSRDLKKIADRKVKEKIEQVILTVQKAQTIKDIPELKKMKGDKKGISYRIKVDDYRIGVTIEHDSVTFVVCMPRKDIYRSFP